MKLKKPKMKIRYPGMVQFQAYFKPETHQGLKVMAAMTGVSMVKIVQEAVDGAVSVASDEKYQPETREEILG